jgi:hypothetical protein
MSVYARRRLVLLLLVTAAVAAALIAGCGGGAAAGGGPLAWAGQPELFAHPTLKDDRVLTGTLRNDSLRRVQVNLGDLRVLSADGDEVPAQPIFLRTFGKSLWSPGRGPEQLPASELMRTGRIAYLKPGDEVPLTVAWHAADGEPALVSYGAGQLQLPG